MAQPAPDKFNLSWKVVPEPCWSPQAACRSAAASEMDFESTYNRAAGDLTGNAAIHSVRLQVNLCAWTGPQPPASADRSTGGSPG